jgi:hypothetical protein
VRLDVADPAAGRPGERLEGAELVEDVGGELGGGHVELAPAEADQVRVRHLGADRHPAPDGRAHRPLHRRRVPGVEPAGDVRAGHDLQQGGVVAQVPAPVALAEVGVQVHVAIVAQDEGVPGDRHPLEPLARPDVRGDPRVPT